VVDAAQRVHDGASIEVAGRLLRQCRELVTEAETLETQLAELEAAIGAGGPVGPSDSVQPGSNAMPRPPSILLLPAGGEDSSRHFHDTVEHPVSLDRLDAWLPSDAAAIRSRVTNRLAAWGLRDNTRLRTTVAAAPLIWDRIHEGTLALFSNGYAFSCSAQVIGKGRSDAASEELWHSPEFRWLLLLTDLTDVRIPLNVVLQGAGFDPTYRINRQAIVPKPHREAGLWKALQPYLTQSGSDGNREA
jgi:hypothetical protein